MESDSTANKTISDCTEKYMPVKKQKKLKWNQISINANPHSELAYINACSDALIQKMGSELPKEIFKPGYIKPPTPLSSLVEYKRDGFPSLSIQNNDGLSLPCDESSQRSQFVSNNEAYQKGHSYINPHPSVFLDCSLCQTKVKSTDIQHALYLLESHSPWHIICTQCSLYKKN